MTTILIDALWILPILCVTILASRTGLFKMTRVLLVHILDIVVYAPLLLLIAAIFMVIDFSYTSIKRMLTALQ